MLDSESCVGAGGVHLYTPITVWRAGWAEVTLTGNDANALTKEKIQYEDKVIRFGVRTRGVENVSESLGVANY